MAIYAIADLHLSLGTDKPMDIFNGWQDYVTRLENNWKRLVKDQDTVIIAGDISWAMRLENCYQDFDFINKLPGTKIILKGNHDYWWSTMNKMNEYLEKNEFNTIKFLFNNCYLVEDYVICGSRSWMMDVQQEQDQKVLNRELARLEASLNMGNSYQDKEKLVFLHYPPIYYGLKAEQVIEILNKYNVKSCYYGHLHSASIKNAVNAEIDGIKYKLISADAINFEPLKLN